MLHVVDAASPDLAEQMREVERVLDEIGAGEVEQLVVFNKIDRLDETERPRVLADSVELPSGRRVPRLFVSAVSGEGLAALRECVATLAVREPGAGSLNRDAGASPEAGPAASGDEGEDLRVGTYHSHA